MVTSTANETELLSQVNSLLLENREIARQIAAKLGIETSGATPSAGDPAEQNNALIIRSQMLFKQNE